LQERSGADARVDRCMAAYNSKESIWWRVSKENTAHVGSLVDILKEQKQVEAMQEFDAVYQAMRRSLAASEHFFIEQKSAAEMALADNPNVLTDAAKELASDPAPFTRPVYVIVPGQCASACLDAIDVFTQFSTTKLIGAPSSADSTYMDIRVKTLPSGIASVIIPNKMYVNRVRKAGQTYSPALTVLAPDWSETSFLKAIEQDLLSQKP